MQMFLFFSWLPPPKYSWRQMSSSPDVMNHDAPNVIGWTPLPRANKEDGHVMAGLGAPSHRALHVATSPSNDSLL
jgi:hypothetical protein